MEVLIVKGLIIKETPFSEADKIFTVLTDTIGKITVKSRGVRKCKSHMAGGAQLLCFSEMKLRKTGEFYQLCQVMPLHHFIDLAHDIKLFALANYFSEITSSFYADDHETNLKLLKLLLNALYLLTKTPDLEIVKPAYELKMLCLSGYTPLIECADCSLVSDKLIFLNGQFLCADCNKDNQGGIIVNKAIVQAFSYICSNENPYCFDLSENSKKILLKVCENAIVSNLEYFPKSLAYYKNVKI